MVYSLRKFNCRKLNYIYSTNKYFIGYQRCNYYINIHIGVSYIINQQRFMSCKNSLVKIINTDNKEIDHLNDLGITKLMLHTSKSNHKLSDKNINQIILRSRNLKYMKMVSLSTIIYSLYQYNNKILSLRKLLPQLTRLVKEQHCTSFDAQGICNSIYGLQNINADVLEIRIDSCDHSTY